MILNLNGIPSDNPSNSVDVFFSLNSQGAWLPSKGDLSFEIEAECIRIHDALAEAIFGSLQTYHDLFPSIPDFLFLAGLNSESTMSRSEFEKCLVEFKELPKLYQLLYLYDCRCLVTAIQECTKETLYLQGEFYRSLNLDPLFCLPIDEPDGIRWVTSPTVTSIHAVLGFIYIRLYSLLDYTTKLAYESEHFRTEFSKYDRLSSKNVQFGDRKQLVINGSPGTLFESCALITEIEVYRNRIIHDGLLDDLPKVYKIVSSGQTVEKFILLPDRGPEGRFETFKNRSLFFSREDRINLRLPASINAIQRRQIATLKLLFPGLGTPESGAELALPQ